MLRTPFLVLILALFSTGCEEHSAGTPADDTEPSSQDTLDVANTDTSSDTDSHDTVPVEDTHTGDTDAPETGEDTSVSLDTPPLCSSSEHVCEDACVSNDSPDTCGEACSPCPAPADASATCVEGACGFSCNAGYVLCKEACIPVTQSCGVALPDVACTSDDACGAAGVCADGTCLCATGQRACPDGCCPVTTSHIDQAGVAGEDVQLEFGPDGTAYILVQTEVGESPDNRWELHLYTRAPGATTLERANLTLPVSYDDETFDVAIRDDNTLFAAVAPETGEGVSIWLHTWKPSMTEPVSEAIGTGFGYNVGIGLSIDSDQTVWVSWSTQRNGGLTSYSIDSSDVRRSFSHTSRGTVEQSDVELNPNTQGIYAFWGNRFSGDFRSGVVTLDDGPDLTATCPADDAVFDSQGRLWSIYNSYSSIRTHF